jgi:hypothetical protein
VKCLDNWKLKKVRLDTTPNNNCLLLLAYLCHLAYQDTKILYSTPGFPWIKALSGYIDNIKDILKDINTSLIENEWKKWWYLEGVDKIQ